MRLLKSLFMPHTPQRNFALLDAKGCCLAFKHCSLPPVGDGWVEVEEVRLSWMHRPLPASARISPRILHAHARQALAS
ncbi:hypothetical protein GIR22_18680 [Pseudomonas sp. CCM 7891]|uniref:Uncharacterized protein n=1 Tax=Pseudomonas karstica TaxID=1055468 RepID=A0A7X2V0G4_9PSED|nr:hypothetical protein [Pseudomonas karstica]MTD21150.1 hypothetical protein [Pseudomonas karstica]